MSETEQKPARSLVRKLAEVMGEVARVPKNGRNNFHNYDYATESDITSAVRAAMAQRHLMLVPDVVKSEFGTVARKNGTERLATLTVKFTVSDGDSGESMEFHAVGEGTDAGDKATYKAMTGALKYALLKLFMIPTGDDPEKDDEPRPPQRGQRAAPRSESARAAEPPPPPEPKGATPILDNPFRALQAAMHKRGVPSKEWGAVLKERRGRTSAASVTAADVKWMEDYFDGAHAESPRDSTELAPGNP